MRKLAWWFCMFGMTLRRALYRPVFLLFLLIFPLGMGVLHQVEKRDSGRIAVALCPGTDAWNQALAERLESEESRSFFFLSVRDGGRGKEGGYDRTGGVRLPVSEIKGTAGRGALYPCGPRAGVAVHSGRKLYQKKIFSELFEVYGRELLADYGENGAAFQTVMARCQTTEAREKACGVLMELYEKYRSNGSTFTFDYQTLQGGTALQTGAMKVVFPVRGLTAVFLFIMGLAAAVMAGEDVERGLYAAVRSRERWLLQTADRGVCIFSIHFGLCGASGIGKWGRAAFRGGKLLFLSLLRDHVCLWMPGSLPEAGISGGADSGVYPCEPPALSDLFDASLFLPGAAGVRKLLPPWWYLSGIFRVSKVSTRE